MRKPLLFILLIAAVLFAAAIPAGAQMTQEERDIIIEEILKRLDIDTLIDQALEKKLPDITSKSNEFIAEKYSYMKQEIKSEIVAEFGNGISQSNSPMITKENAKQPKEETPVIQQPAPQKQETKTYVGPHVKFVNSYAYTQGKDDESGKHEFKSEYYPNELFTVDVVFENDGNAALPPNLELRHTGGTGEYTGHTESAFSYGKVVKPGERIGFSFAAHGSENIGNISFNFQMFDADSGNAVNGGYGSFFYTARP